MIKMQLIGYIGQDARVSSTEHGSVANFSVAHSEKYKDSQGVQKDRTTWVDCSIWDRPALHDYLKKGQLVFLEGFPGTKQYENREQRIVSQLRLTVLSLQLLGGKIETNKAELGQSNEDGAGGNDQSDDLPF